MNELPKFLVLRFPIGAAGNLLSSILQCSPEVGHWNESLEKSKPNSDWNLYFKQVFTDDLTLWLENEPIGKHQLGTRNVFSAHYPRGNDLTVEEFLQMEETYCTDYYLSLRKEDKFIPIFWHKTFFPSYFQRATIVNILLDKKSIRWYDRAYLNKHFYIKETDNKLLVTNKSHRPQIVPKTFTGVNVYQEEFDSFCAFAKKNIFNNPMRSLYLNHDMFLNFGNRPQKNIYLSSLISTDDFIEAYPKLCRFLDITPISISTARQLHEHWVSCHKNLIK